MQKKRFFRVIIQCFIFLILIEFFFRFVFYQQVGREHLAVIEIAKNIKRIIFEPGIDRVYQDFLLARPDSAKEVNKLIAEEAAASNHYEYSPWTEYRNIDFSGKYIHTKGLVRQTVPDQYINSSTTATQTIYFFGGSTMYGVNIADRETVASAFVDLYKSQFPQGVSIKVVNYGVPAYYSYNELMLLSHLVYSGQKPGIAIMLDGLNDFLMPSAAQRRLPYYYYRLALASQDRVNFKKLESINDSTATLFDYPRGYTEQALTDTLLKNYLANINHIKAVALSNKFEAFFFIQPNPFYNYPNSKYDPICDKYQAPLVTKAYEVLDKSAASIGNCTFLGNMLVAEKGYPFIDRFHYSPSMCHKIAKEIVMVIGKKINGH